MKYRSVLLLILYVFATLVIMSMIKSVGLVDKRVGVIAMTNFEGHKPFQYRVFMPVLIRGIEYLTPEVIQNSIADVVKKYVGSSLAENYDGYTEVKAQFVSKYGYRSFLYLLLNACAMFLFLVCLRQLALAFGIFSKTLCDILPLGMVLVMPVFFDYGIYIYDFSHLLLFTAGLLTLYKKQWPAFFIIFALALLNKETAIMLTLIFGLVYYSELPRKQFIKLLTIQIMIFLVIKISLYFIFIDNPGTVAEWHLKWNIIYLITPSNYFRFERLGSGMFTIANFDIRWPVGINLPMFAVIIAMVAYRWPEKPLFLRKASLYLIVTFALAMTMGCINELRAYYDALPIIYILGLSGIVKFYERLKLKLAGI
jgi:hypothetical protein